VTFKVHCGGLCQVLLSTRTTAKPQLTLVFILSVRKKWVPIHRYLGFFILFCLFGSIGFWTHSLMLARQSLYYLNHASNTINMCICVYIYLYICIYIYIYIYICILTFVYMQTFSIYSATKQILRNSKKLKSNTACSLSSIKPKSIANL
jgi:hypothetical protein